MFCICCLDDTGPYIKLNKCIHSDYLEMFTIPNLNPPLEQIICNQCHSTLKKINQFKLQVKETLNLLQKQATKLEPNHNKKNNIAMSKITHLNIPDLNITENNDVQIKNDKTENIEIALQIINNNSSSLQSLAVCNFAALLQATTASLNLETLVLPQQKEISRMCQNEKDHDKEVVNTDAVLPANSKKEKDENIKTGKTSLLPVKNVNNIEELSNTIKQEIDDLSNYNDCPIKMENENETVNFVEKLSKNGIEKDIIISKENKNCQKTILPFNEEKDMEVIIDNVYGTAVLPDIKKELDGISNESAEDKDSSSENSNDDIEAISDQRLTSFLIPIKLNRSELNQERKDKLLSKEFLQWRHRCDNCIIGFNYKINLDDHNQRKHELKPGSMDHICEICQQIVVSGEARHHKFRHYNRLECIKCKKRFVLFDEAYEHYKEVHTTDNTIKRSRKDFKTVWRSRKRKYNTDNCTKTSDDQGNPSTTSSKETNLCLPEDFAKDDTKDVANKINKLY